MWNGDLRDDGPPFTYETFSILFFNIFLNLLEASKVIGCVGKKCQATREQERKEKQIRKEKMKQMKPMTRKINLVRGKGFPSSPLFYF